MSSYYDTAIRKEDLDFSPENWEEVEMLDNYFGQHNYGVRFPNGEILKPEDVYFRREVLDSTQGSNIWSYTGNTEIYRDNKPNRLQKLIKKLRERLSKLF